jgi:hypothetical protein
LSAGEREKNRKRSGEQSDSKHLSNPESWRPSWNHLYSQILSPVQRCDDSSESIVFTARGNREGGVSCHLKECMSGLLSQVQIGFERSLAKITLADLVGQIRQKTH